MSEKVDCLHYKTQDQIELPAYADLQNALLTWRWTEHAAWEVAKRPIAGCLDEFIRLERASEEEVLAFVRKRGVLGLMPLVSKSKWHPGSVSPFFWTAYQYWEPVFLYTQLAHRFGSILRVMQALKDREPVKEADYYGCYAPEMAGIQMSADKDRAQMNYRGLVFEVADLWQVATTKIGISGLTGSDDGIQITDPLTFELGFGRWLDGRSWDDEAAKRSRHGAMLTPRVRELEIAAYHLAAKGQGRADEELEASGYRKDGSGEWLKPYQEEVKDYYGFDLAAERPSVLFNVLVYQLMKAISLPVNTYFCSQCNKRYEYDPKKVKKPADSREARREAANWGNSKPREGRTTCFCCQECRLEHGKVDDVERYSASKSRKAKAAEQ